MPRPIDPHNTEIKSIHNLSSHNIQPENITILTKGLSFAPTSNTPKTKQKLELHRQFDDFARSLRSIYVHATHKKPPKNTPPSSLVPETNPDRSFIYRKMRFLPTSKTVTYTQVFSRNPTLESYIEETKTNLDEKLEKICESNGQINISKTEQRFLKRLKHTRNEVTIKPADKNLGIVVLDTDDYLQLCASQLADTTIYRQSNDFPTAEILKKLQSTITSFPRQLKALHKNLQKFLIPNAKNTQPPKFYGIPKIHKSFTHLPPVRPIVSHSNSILSPSAHFIDHVLQPIAKSYPDYLQNSTSLAFTLQDLRIPDESILVTIDVQSLYPSIPQTECLEIIYQEIHTRNKLLITHPNLVIQLLHTNINFNYFEFATLYFQQIKGTAMGAAFSPTIANIYLSVILHRFLQTQPYQPLFFKRYIDDIFLIWPHSPTELKKFIEALNNFHCSLKFTCETSTSTANFLDLTIYKGITFEYTTILDVKTYQKEKNLYQYLHYKSNHPPSVYKGIIKGECVRYARTNSTPENYHAMTQLLRQRLLQRQYPPRAVDKIILEIKYEDRQKYLRPKPPQSQPRRPIFKCLPPPQYTMLKAVVLQHYSRIQKYAPKPRFIALGHNTLHKELVRARVEPTADQFVDIILTLGENNSPNQHQTAGNMPVTRYTARNTTPCRHPRCGTCKQLNCNNYFKSTSTSLQYTLRHSFTCTSANVIYLITCTKCKKQYVGYTTTQLNQRINRHRTNINNNKTIYICVHFNFHDHSIKNLSVQAIDTASTLKDLKRLERFWIQTLQTYVPKGLNVSLGSD